MDQNEPDKKKHHFLYYIFKADKEANPMEESKAAGLRQILQQMFANFQKGEEP